MGVRLVCVQLGPTLCHSWTVALPVSSVHGVLQAGVLSGWPSPPPGDLPSPGTEPDPLTSPALETGSLLLASAVKPGSALVAIITEQYFNVLVFTLLQMPHSPTTFFQTALEFLLRWRNGVLKRPMDIISRGSLLSGPW